MLEAYINEQTLLKLEARLPESREEVIRALEAMADDRPFNPRAALVLARCYRQDGLLDQSKQILEALLEHGSNDVNVKIELAKIFQAQKDIETAKKLFTEVTQTRPELVENWLLLENCLRSSGQNQAAKSARNQYNMIRAFNEDLDTAQTAFSRGDYARADHLCRKLLAQVSGEFRAMRLLAKLARHFRHYEVGTSILAQCVETRPGDSSLGLEYAYSLLSSRMFEQALTQCQRLIELAPEEIDIYDVKAAALVAMGRYDEAVVIYRELVEVHEQPALCHVRLGNVLKTTAETTEAISRFQRAMALDPMLGEAYWSLASLKTYAFSTKEITSMQQLIEAKGIRPMDKVLMQFALGKALEDAQQFEGSFKYYQSANEAYTKIRPSRYSSLNATLKSFFTTEYFSGTKANGHDSVEPIFVVGMPRSGSTLVEQILASHSLVDATRELTEIITIARRLNIENQPGQGKYPQSMAGLSRDDIRGLAQNYLDHAREFRQQAPYFVDKAPGNFHHIGLIKTLFPKARIIDVRRNPMASGWSLYKHFFAGGNEFSYSLKTIGKYYNDYIELMNHWHAVLPGQILTLKYEDLVTDLPGNVETLLQYCSLEFEDACLDFHLNKRPVATPSSEQVRQPVYSDALEHWKNYEEYLLPLKKIVSS